MFISHECTMYSSEFRTDVDPYPYSSSFFFFFGFRDYHWVCYDSFSQDGKGSGLRRHVIPE